MGEDDNGKFRRQRVNRALFEHLMRTRVRILVQVTIYRRLLIGRDGHLDQSEAYDISQLVREYGPRYISAEFMLG